MPKIVIIDEVLRKVRYYKNKMVQFFLPHMVYMHSVTSIFMQQL